MSANVQEFNAMRCTHPAGRYQNRNAYTIVNLQMRTTMNSIDLFAAYDRAVSKYRFTFIAFSEQHDCLHFVNLRRFCCSPEDVVVVVVVVVAVVVTGVVAFWAGTKAVLAFAVLPVT